MPTICPRPRANMPGKTASIACATPSTFTSSMARNPGVSRSRHLRQPADPRARDEHVGRPDRGLDGRDRRLRSRRRRSHPPRTPTAPTLRYARGTSSRRSPSRSIRPEAIAAARQRERRRAADPVRGPGEDRRPGLDPPLIAPPRPGSSDSRNDLTAVDEPLGVLLGGPVLGVGDDGRPAVRQVLAQVLRRGQERRVLAVEGQARGSDAVGSVLGVSPATAFESSPAGRLAEPEQPVHRRQADRLAEPEHPLVVEVHHLVEELAEVVPVLVRERRRRPPRPRCGRSASGPSG